MSVKILETGHLQVTSMSEHCDEADYVNRMVALAEVLQQREEGFLLDKDTSYYILSILLDYLPTVEQGRLILFDFEGNNQKMEELRLQINAMKLQVEDVVPARRKEITEIVGE